VLQLVKKGRGYLWTLLKEEQPNVFFPNNLDGRKLPHLVIHLRQICIFFLFFYFLVSIAYFVNG
jgi:hypothetical protein